MLGKFSALRTAILLGPAFVLGSVGFASNQVAPSTPIQPLTTECFAKLMTRVGTTKPINAALNSTNNLVLDYLKIDLYEWINTTAYDPATSTVPLPSTDAVLANQRLSLWEQNLGSNQKVLFVKISNEPPYAGTDTTKPKDFLLDLSLVLGNTASLSSTARLFSVFVSGENSASIDLSQLYYNRYRIYIKQSEWSEDLTFIIVYNAEICKATYSSTAVSTNTIYTGIFESWIFTPNKSFTGSFSPFLTTNGTLNFEDYSNPAACVLPVPVLSIKDRLSKARLSKRTITDADLEYIKSSCNCNKLKINVCKKMCKPKENKCKIEVTFHKYITYIVTSIKTLCIYRSSSYKFYQKKCENLFVKCARKCEDKFEGCNVVMHTMGDVCHKALSRISVCVEAYFSLYVKYNPYLCVSYKQGTSIYGLSKHDRKCFGRLISKGEHMSSSSETCELVEKSEEQTVDETDEAHKDKKEKKGFFTKYKWHITITVVVTVVAAGVYAFAL